MTVAFHRKFISGVVGLSLLITAGAAAPARADSDDVGRAVAALLGLAIVGAVIADARKDDRKAKAQVVRPEPIVTPRRTVTPRPLPRDVRRKLLPQQCLRNFNVQDGVLPAFGQRCLSRNYEFSGALPGRCYREVWTDRGRRGVYTARCLRRQGYQLARR